MKKKKKPQQQVAEILLEYLTGVYVGFMLLIFPLVFHNAYFDIFTTKRYAYLVATSAFLIFAAVLLLVLLAQRSLKLTERIGKPVLCFAGAELLLLLFSLLLVDNPAEMFWGVSGRRLGVLVMCMCVVTMLLIAAYGAWQTSARWCLLIGSAVVYFLQITDEWQLNLLGMHLPNVQDTLFISTIGNINFNAAFNCLTLPVGIALYMNAKEKVYHWIYGIFCVLGFAATICCRSDSGILGLGVSILVLFYIKRSDEKSSIRFANVFVFWIVASVFVLLGYERTQAAGYYISGAVGIFVKGKLIVAELVIALIWYLLLWGCRNREHMRKCQHKIIGIALLVILLAVIACVLVINVRHIDLSKYPELARYVVFDDSWGSRRGFIWKETWKQYWQFDIKKLLFGCGITNYKTTAVIESAEYGLAAGATIDAHCELLQLLFTTGIFGVISYFGMELSVLIASIRAYRNDRPEALMGILVISGYLAQGMVNNLQIATTPVWFVLLGLFCAVTRKTT